MLNYEAGTPSKTKKVIMIIVLALIGLAALGGIAKVVHDFWSQDHATRVKARSFVVGFIVGTAHLPCN